MGAQDENLKRVKERIAPAILEFFGGRLVSGRIDFHAEEMRRYVRAKVGEIAPGSPDRVMRDLRQEGLLDYEVISRSESLYRIKWPFDDNGQPPEVEVDFV